MNIINAERALTAFWADALGLTVDTNIFRAGIPAGMAEGVTVILGTEITSNDQEIKKYNVQLLGKYNDRDVAKQFIEDISNALPCYGQAVTLLDDDEKEYDFTFRGMIKHGSGGTWTQTDDGQKKTYASFNLIAAF
jgi:hypothetical protein